MNTIIRYNRNIQPYAKILRNRMTSAEVVLWSKIKNKKIFGLQFYRQFIIESYILDFYCKSKKLAIEVDGPIHNTDTNINSDNNRDYVLKSYGIQVLRFTNEEIFNDLAKVIYAIKLAVQT